MRRSSSATPSRPRGRSRCRAAGGRRRGRRCWALRWAASAVVVRRRGRRRAALGVAGCCVVVAVGRRGGRRGGRVVEVVGAPSCRRASACRSRSPRGRRRGRRARAGAVIDAARARAVGAARVEEATCRGGMTMPSAGRGGRMRSPESRLRDLGAQARRSGARGCRPRSTARPMPAFSLSSETCMKTMPISATPMSAIHARPRMRRSSSGARRRAWRAARGAAPAAARRASRAGARRARARSRGGGRAARRARASRRRSAGARRWRAQPWSAGGVMRPPRASVRRASGRTSRAGWRRPRRASARRRGG